MQTMQTIFQSLTQPLEQMSIEQFIAAQRGCAYIKLGDIHYPIVRIRGCEHVDYRVLYICDMETGARHRMVYLYPDSLLWARLSAHAYPRPTKVETGMHPPEMLADVLMYLCETLEIDRFTMAVNFHPWIEQGLNAWYTAIGYLKTLTVVIEIEVKPDVPDRYNVMAFDSLNLNNRQQLFSSQNGDDAFNYLERLERFTAIEVDPHRLPQFLS